PGNNTAVTVLRSTAPLVITGGGGTGNKLVVDDSIGTGAINAALGDVIDTGSTASQTYLNGFGPVGSGVSSGTGIIVDDGQATYSPAGDWVNDPGFGGLNNNFHFPNPGAGPATTTRPGNGLAPGSAKPRGTLGPVG